MSQFLNVNIDNDTQSNQASPTSPKLSREFSTLRVVSEDSIAPPSLTKSSSVSSAEQFEDAPSAVSPLEALAQLCAAEKDNSNGATFSAPASNSQVPANPHNFRVSKNDVLCGRGGLTNHHSGNVFFRQLVRIKQESYLLASKREKAGVAREIVDLIRKLNPPGRFLKKDPKNPNVWIEIGDRKAREKTSQALREGAPELRVDLQQQQQQQQHAAAMLSEEARGIMENLTTKMNHQGKQFLNPNTKTMWMEQGAKNLVTPTASTDDHFNRARIVSDDSVGVGGFSQFLQEQQQESLQQPHLIVDQPQQEKQEERRDSYSGTKRSRDESSACSVQEQKRDMATKRGPRLKLIKSRMECCM